MNFSLVASILLINFVLVVESKPVSTQISNQVKLVPDPRLVWMLPILSKIDVKERRKMLRKWAEHLFWETGDPKMFALVKKLKQTQQRRKELQQKWSRSVMDMKPVHKNLESKFDNSMFVLNRMMSRRQMENVMKKEQDEVKNLLENQAKLHRFP